jgi:hypothetical protein
MVQDFFQEKCKKKTMKQDREASHEISHLFEHLEEEFELARLIRIRHGQIWLLPVSKHAPPANNVKVSACVVYVCVGLMRKIYPSCFCFP